MPATVINLEQIIPASTGEVYLALTNSTALREWLADIALADPKPGGRLYLWWNSGYSVWGEFVSLEAERKVAFTWHGRHEPSPTQVTLTLTPHAAGTLLHLEHAGLTDIPAWERPHREIEHGWVAGLKNLVSVMSTGEDLRIVNRPMLGISLGDFSAEVAKQLHVPVTEGLRLSGVVAEMGAARAGLQKDDVIVEVNRVPIPDFPALANIVQGRAGGDILTVVFYRGAEKQTVQMELSRRPVPHIPGTAAEVVAAYRTIYRPVLDELITSFNGVSEEEASRKPAPDEWSAREVLAHLIHGDRGFQNYMNDIISGAEPIYDSYADNLPARIAGTLAAYPATPDMLHEIERLFTETCEMVAQFSPQIVNRKRTFWRIAYTLLVPPLHLQEHIEQIRAAVATGTRTE